MYIHGEFINKRDERVAVRILTNGDRSEEMEIGTEESGLWFAAESPVVVENEVDDTFDVLLRRSAKITLLCRNYVSEFFCTSARSAVVNVLKDGRCVFAGFLEPQTYSQPYNETLDELELNCLDALSGLQYMNYKAVGSLGVVYEVVRSETSQRTFGELVLEVLRSVSEGLDLTDDAAVETAAHEDSGESSAGGKETSAPCTTAGDEDSGESSETAGGKETSAPCTHVWFDGSKGASKDGCKGTRVFDELAVNDLLFMGGSADEVWRQDEVLEEVLKYLDLHVVQDGFDFYIFSWETVKGNAAVETAAHEDGGDSLAGGKGTSAPYSAGGKETSATYSAGGEETSATYSAGGEETSATYLAGAVTWYELGGDGTRVTERKEVTISLDAVEGMDTEISIGEVYNQLLLTADMEKVENVVENPLDSDALTSVYDGMQKYMTEYIADIDTSSTETDDSDSSESGTVEDYEAQEAAFEAFRQLLTGGVTKYKDAYVTDWYMRLKTHAHWTFPMGDWQPVEGKAPKSADEDLAAYAKRNGAGQNRVLNWLQHRPGKGCLVALGGDKVCQADSDNAPKKPQLDNCLVVGIGDDYRPVTGEDGSTDYETAILAPLRNLDKALRANRPCAVYSNVQAAAAFSPSDANITNYMVVSGKISYSPYAFHTCTVRGMRELKGLEQYSFYNKTVYSSDEGSRYYAQLYYNTEDPSSAPEDDLDQCGVYPFTGEGRLWYKYQGKRDAETMEYDKTDGLSKWPVLACMLVIGDKCVVETGELGQKTEFEWRTYKSRAECGSDDEYYAQCFYIGFDPQIDHSLNGEEYDMQNTVTIATGIDAEGIAIPMRLSDKLSGAAQFTIIGPAMFGLNLATGRMEAYEDSKEWVRQHTFVALNVNSIMLKDFEVKVYSDSGHYDGGGDDKDVVYMSDTKEKFVNRKEDIEFKINSALTAAECRSLGVQNSVNMSTPVNTVTGEGVLTIYDKSRDEAAKAEQLYVDSYYTEYHKPRILLTQTVRDDEDVVGLFNHYRHEALNKEFYVQGVGFDLMEGEATLTLKEVSEE